jgi:transcriptional regulator with XRE-family HTH domain
MIDGENGRPFNEWLRAQLRAKKMSQRQLAQQSGVDHSTISRLIRGDRTPSLETATRLAKGLRELRDGQEPTQYLGLLQQTPTNPVARVEYALRADETLDEADIRGVMEAYLSARIRRMRGAVTSVTRSGDPRAARQPLAPGSNGNGRAMEPQHSRGSSRTRFSMTPVSQGRGTE